jgi:hypothetical protein
VSNAADVCGFLANPAELAVIRPLGVSFFHVPGLFGLNELRLSGGGLVIPVGSVGVGVQGTWFGGELYRETVLGAAIGEELLPGVGIGLRVRLNGLSISGYGSCSVISVDAGIRAGILSNLTLACFLTNLTSARTGQSGEILPQELSGGLTYAPIPELEFLLAAGKELLSPLELRIGVEAGILEPIMLRIGWVDEPSLVTAGCGIRVGAVTLDYAYVHHWVLGASHEIGVSLSFP